MERQPDQDQDFETELRGDIEEQMNEKRGSVGPAIVAALVVATADVGVKFFFEKATDTSTVAALAELRTNVANLSSQLTDFTRQPYVRRDEFESRVSGFEQRIGYIERQEQQRGQR